MKKGFFAALFVLSMLAILLIPSVVHSQGCPPNRTCPRGSHPVAIDCWSGYCDKIEISGYCILCRPDNP